MFLVGTSSVPITLKPGFSSSHSRGYSLGSNRNGRAPSLLLLRITSRQKQPAGIKPIPCNPLRGELPPAPRSQLGTQYSKQSIPDRSRFVKPLDR